MIIEVKSMSFVNLDQIDWFGKSDNGITFMRGDTETFYHMDEDKSVECLARIICEHNHGYLRYLDLRDITGE